MRGSPRASLARDREVVVGKRAKNTLRCRLLNFGTVCWSWILFDNTDGERRGGELKEIVQWAGKRRVTGGMWGPGRIGVAPLASDHGGGGLEHPPPSVAPCGPRRKTSVPIYTPSELTG